MGRHQTAPRRPREAQHAQIQTAVHRTTRPSPMAAGGRQGRPTKPRAGREVVSVHSPSHTRRVHGGAAAMTAHAWITSAAMVAGFILVMVLLGRLSRDLVAMEIDRVRREHRILDAVEYGLEESRLLAMLDQVRPWTPTRSRTRLARCSAADDSDCCREPRHLGG